MGASPSGYCDAACQEPVDPHLPRRGWYTPRGDESGHDSMRSPMATGLKDSLATFESRPFEEEGLQGFHRFSPKSPLAKQSRVAALLSPMHAQVPSPTGSASRPSTPAAMQMQLAMSQSPVARPSPMAPHVSPMAPHVSPRTPQRSPMAPPQLSPQGWQQTLEGPRPGEYTATLERPLQGRAKVGLHVKPMQNSRLNVTSVSDGLLQDWNIAHPAEAVKVGSSIMAVNGVRGDTKMMLEQIRTARVLIMYVKPMAATAQQ